MTKQESWEEYRSVRVLSDEHVAFNYAWDAAYAAGRKAGMEEAARIAEDVWTDEFTSPNETISAASREAAK